MLTLGWPTRRQNAFDSGATSLRKKWKLCCDQTRALRVQQSQPRPVGELARRGGPFAAVPTGVAGRQCSNRNRPTEG